MNPRHLDRGTSWRPGWRERLDHLNWAQVKVTVIVFLVVAVLWLPGVLVLTTSVGLVR